MKICGASLFEHLIKVIESNVCVHGVMKSGLALCSLYGQNLRTNASFVQQKLDSELQ